MNNRIVIGTVTVIVFVMTLVGPSMSQQKPIGLFAETTGVGNPKLAGKVSYNEARQEYTIDGAGTNMWLGRDEFQFLWQRLKGNFMLTTNVRFVGKGVEPHRKIGWTVRQSLEPDSPHVTAVVHGDGRTSLQFRRTKGAITQEIISKITAADVIQLERKGNTYIMSVARSGDPFATEQIADIDLGNDVQAGLFVCSHNKDVVEQAVFHNVRITLPASDTFVPYRDYIGSNLEVMDLADNNRRILYRIPGSLQAPNWTRDGKFLIYNQGGRLYRFDLATNTPTVIDTGFAVNNNNDHVLSFDGKMLAISNHSKDDQNRSIIYVLPTKGGVPKRVTANGPSYLHSWSLDGKSLFFTGQRDGELDIYKISVNGGEEKALTNAKGVDDGPELTPDGKYIYFNSSRTGLMQIWRMKPDGSNQEQVTNDEFNNWFPHISPDGKWIVILSFLQDINSADHPFYKHVYIRLLPAAGGTPPKVIAYLYGGQGTINVPSWSPDSKRIAFVSNTDGIQ
ncbi:MAG TPA: hypothetical protein VKB46_17920 [Pyrinomonadaceae bacterium]|nr:hypothetical protein [Pyrinomonadaceae bacterium]